MPIIDAVPEVDWQHGVDVWREFFKKEINVPTSPTEGWQARFDRLKSGVSELISPKPKPEAEVNEPKTKKRRVELDPDMPSFRVTCHRTGKHSFQSPQAACLFGGAVQDYFQWNVNLKEYDLEVVLDIRGNEVSVLIALTTESLHRRLLTKFGPTSLRATIAYGMLRYALRVSIHRGASFHNFCDSNISLQIVQNTRQ